MRDGPPGRDETAPKTGHPMLAVGVDVGHPSLGHLWRRVPFLFEARIPFLEYSVEIVLWKPNITEAAFHNPIVRSNLKRD